ncbi:MAG TPA: hypothetical protein VG722_05945 [Tepidisphaeraceae bacterium]|nr:hypothetical protein [Tepidisphaeraceae bacterium]
MPESTLQGWIPPLASDDEIRHALEEAFSYRGDVTLTLKDQTKIEGYIFDRRSEGKTLADCRVRLLPKDGASPINVNYSNIAAIEFTGRDPATGKSFETWIRKYRERKLAGEKNISLMPEKLE